MALRARLIGPLPGLGARRVSWDRAGRLAITLTADRRLVGLGPDERVWDQPARGVTALTWDPGAPLLAVVGGSILVDGSGTARVDPSGADLLLAPSAQLLASHRVPHGVVVRSPDGTVVLEQPAHHVSWRPEGDELLIVDEAGVARLTATGARTGVVADDLERGPLFARWSPAGTALVTWGQYGPFDVRDEAGALLRSFPAHTDGSNLAAALGATLLVTSGEDGRLVIDDVLRGAVLEAVDVGAPPVRVDLDPSERLMLVVTLDDEVIVIDLATFQPVELARPASWARWSPAGTALACCDGDDLWLQVWD